MHAESCDCVECYINRLEDALRFYADRKNWDQFGVVHDDPEGCACGMKHHHPDTGRRARVALGIA